VCFSLCFLAVVRLTSSSSSTYSHDVLLILRPKIMEPADRVLKPWAKINLFSLTLLFSSLYHSHGKMTNTHYTNSMVVLSVWLANMTCPYQTAFVSVNIRWMCVYVLRLSFKTATFNKSVDYVQLNIVFLLSNLNRLIINIHILEDNIILL
jgi:hypothetical protein